MTARITGTGPSELKVLAAKVRAADPALKRDLRRGLRDAAAAAADRAQESILSMPSHHDGTLRGEIAATVSVSTRISAAGIEVAVVSAGAKMPPGKEELPAYTNRPRGWSHPVYGNRETWVHQVGKPGWFDAPIALAGRDARRACQDVMDATKRRLGG